MHPHLYKRDIVVYLCVLWMKSIILGGYGNQHLWGLGTWVQNGAIELIIEVFIYSICLGYGHLDVILI